MSSSDAASSSQLMQERENEIALLQERVASLSQQLENTLKSQNVRTAPGAGIPGVDTGDNNSNGEGGSKKGKLRRGIPLATYTIDDSSSNDNRQNSRLGSFGTLGNNMANNKRSNAITAQREKMRLGRNASVTTQQILQSLHQQQPQQGETPPVIQRILDMFAQPTAHMEYLNSHLFAKDLVKLAFKMCHVLEKEPRVVFVQSPAYVFGDIHGNLEDLHFFSDNIWRLGMSLTAGNFVFLGDFVDRGIHCLECVAYLLAVKYQLPTKVFLLRGNHETRDVNGWEEHYAERSFIYQCRNRFGDDVGYKVWEACNQVFDRLPLAAVIDQDIFCVHGGIPRPISSTTTRIQDILTVPKVAGINPPYQHEDDNYQQVASDCIWSDPASSDQEATTVDPETGFGESLRGGGAICFGNKAVTDFLAQHDFSYIMRAHEAHAEGVAVSKQARVFTVFSTSQDHNQGKHAMAGCILVDNDKLQVINRSPAYKNQYIHRRDSLSLITLPEQEIQKRIQLGLIKDQSNDLPDESSESSEELEEWEDFNAMEEAERRRDSREEYILQKQRRSSIDLSALTTHEPEIVETPATPETGMELEQVLKKRRSTRPSVASIREDDEGSTDDNMECIPPEDGLHA